MILKRNPGNADTLPPLQYDPTTGQFKPKADANDPTTQPPSERRDILDKLGGDKVLDNVSAATLDHLGSDLCQQVANKYGEQSIEILKLIERSGTGTDPKLVIERLDTAFDFYAAHNFRDNTLWIPGHLQGIDFNQHVEVAVIPKGTVLEQWQAPGGSQGSYYAEAGTLPTNLGIHPQATDKTTGEVVDKSVLTYIVVNEDVPGLKTTAASIADTWSVSGESHMTEGGAFQYYAPNRDSFKNQPTTTNTDTPSTNTTTTETTSTHTATETTTNTTDATNTTITEGSGLLSQQKTADGEHELKITEGGKIVKCSTCGELRVGYEHVVAARSDLAARLDATEQKARDAAAATDPEVKKRLTEEAEAETLAIEADLKKASIELAETKVGVDLSPSNLTPLGSSGLIETPLNAKRDAKELALAEEMVALEGQPLILMGDIKSKGTTPGIDGIYKETGQPFQLKTLQSAPKAQPDKVVANAKAAQEKAAKAGWSNVDLHIKADGATKAEVLARWNAPGRVPARPDLTDGTISRVIVHCSDGIIELNLDVPTTSP